MNSSQYRLVHFVPDPFTGGRVPLGAIVRTGRDVVVCRVQHIPGPQCLGGPERAAAASLILDGLGEASGFDRLPTALGPQAVLGQPQEVPANVADAVEWVKRVLSAAEAPPATAIESYRRENRATYGFRFFCNFGVDRWVKKTFTPGVDFGGFLPQARTLGTISHYVEGHDTLLLMEPVVPTKPNADDHVTQIARLFGAYRSVLHEVGLSSADFVTYVLPGGSASLRERIGEDLRPFSNVVDTANTASREKLLRKVRRVGESGEAPTLS